MPGTGKHVASATIFGLSGPELTLDEAAFFRDANPWGFILFARNVVDPGQLRRLTGDLRESVGRDTPILVDQEGGRVQRLRPPHWRGWRDVAKLFDGAEDEESEARALEALRLRYRIIADELHAVGIDVNCAPLLDIPAEGSHEIIGSRALGRGPDQVMRRGRVVCEALLSGGVLPVIKHLPGHGRADADSHLSLPRISTPREELDRTDFVPFRALADQALGMTAHIIFDAIDPDHPATLSPAAIDIIRHEIGFDGLLMTDDLSMQALSGPMERRAGAALAAGCDLVLHCNGNRAEMEAIAGIAPPLSGQAALRAERAEQLRTPLDPPDPIDIAAMSERYAELTGEALIG